MSHDFNCLLRELALLAHSIMCSWRQRLAYDIQQLAPTKQFWLDRRHPMWANMEDNIAETLNFMYQSDRGLVILGLWPHHTRDDFQYKSDIGIVTHDTA